jgi:hypothetical protein
MLESCLGLKLATYLQCQGQRKVDLYINSPICLHGIVLEQLSIGTALTFLHVNKQCSVTDRLTDRVTVPLSEGPNRVDIFISPRLGVDPVSVIVCSLVFKIPDNKQSLKTQ